MQINFGVIFNESLGDAVKITVIATGFQPENSPLPGRRGSATPVIRVQQRPPDPEPLPKHSYVAASRQPEPAPPTIARVNNFRDRNLKTFTGMPSGAFVCYRNTVDRLCCTIRVPRTLEPRSLSYHSPRLGSNSSL